ncbi:MAG TPA: orotate phosphoribosyltransferase [bacterium]|nr:orotate phosphoribosyltransferase [bacterium]
MREEALLRAFEETGALRRGHYELSSGLHSDVYFQAAILLQHPDRAEVVGRALARLLKPLEPEVVVGPALGGIIVGWEVARALGVRGLFTERKDGQMMLRRSFEMKPGERAVVIEDVLTTGKSIRETSEALRTAGAEVVGVGAIVDRSGGAIDFGIPLHVLLSLPVGSWEPSKCPECAQGTPVEKPGSRTQAAVG